jgi:hypothetical protein
MTEKLFKHQIIRLGSNHDGGYFVCPNAVSKSQNLIGIGIETNWEFEKEFLKINPKVKVTTYDGQTNIFLILKFFFKQILKILIFKINWDLLKRSFLNIFEYKYFLIKKLNFVNKNVGLLSGLSFKKIVEGKKNIFLKIDIEGSEYDIIDQILKYSQKIDMLIFEFHWIFSPDKSSYIGNYKDDKFHGNGSYTYGDGTNYTGEFKNGLPNGKGTYVYQDGSKYETEFKDGKGSDEKGIYIPTFNEEIFYESIKKLQRNFEITHLHGNNHNPVNEAGFPHAAEITLVNKKLMPELKEFVYSLPLKNLDYSNQPFKDDLVLSFDK